jgi:hypothetical protein
VTNLLAAAEKKLIVEKLVVAQLFKKFSPLYGTRSYRNTPLFCPEPAESDEK